MGEREEEDKKNKEDKRKQKWIEEGEGGRGEMVNDLEERVRKLEEDEMGRRKKR